jgi:long-chain fatty acid transport protein
MKIKKIAALIAIAGLSGSAFATNGMNMEGYGPVATGMGGASFAYDNGTGGMINNPATLGFMKSGTSRLDIAVGGLHPDVVTSVPAMPAAGKANSGGDAYYMPAVGYVRKDGKLAYGIGMMAQGGMGTEYGKNSLLNNGLSMGAQPISSAGYENRSELGIGRLIFPISYDVSDTFKVGGSIDYLWGGLDLQMTMPGQDFAAMTTGASALGTASGTMVTGLPAMMGGLGWADVHWAQFDFSKGANKMTQELTTNGWAANIGFTWKATPALTIGGVYHAKTSLKDMSGNGQLVMQGGNGAGVTVSTIGVTGKLKVVNFQWPETFGFGMAYQVNDKTTIVADYKRINWASVMKNFRMDFVADGTGATMTAVLFQDWKDQNVYMIGGAYKYTEALTLRAGVNIANNPVPSKYMNYLFPATVKNTLALGFGYSLSPAASIDFSYTYAPDVSVTNNNSGIKTTHGQSNNWQAMYSHRF